MPATRREFLQMSAVVAAGAAAGLSSVLARAGDKDGEGGAQMKVQKDAVAKAGNPLKILVLGGTQFLGPAIVEYALKRGHTLTLFNRGKTNPQLFPDVEKLRGDRKTKDLKSLEGRKWDVVIDDCGYVPRHIREVCEILKGNVQQYVFISSVSAIGDKVAPGTDETAPVATMPDETVEKVMEFYGPLKALCEKAAEEAFPGKTANIRPGLIVGPTDPTDRFTYWPVRVDRGGEVLAPGDPADPLQVIDVRDLGEWIVHVAEERICGVFHALGPPREKKLTIGDLLTACAAASKSKSTFTWVDADFLAQQHVEAWQDMPVWVPTRGDMGGFNQFDVSRAVSKGLRFRPISETVGDTLKWWKSLPEERQKKLNYGISPEREAEVLKAWKERKSSSRKATPKSGDAKDDK